MPIPRVSAAAGLIEARTCGMAARPWLHGNRAPRCRSRGGRLFLRILPGTRGQALMVAVEIDGVLTSRERVEDRPLGILDQILLGYCITVMARKPSELRLWSAFFTTHLMLHGNRVVTIKASMPTPSSGLLVRLYSC